MERMPTDPYVNDLLGFPKVAAEHHKVYIRKLWLPAENINSDFPKFLDSQHGEFARRVNKVVNEYSERPGKLLKALDGNPFLKAEAAYLLQDEGLGYGQRIWGENPETARRLKRNSEGPRLRWGIMTESGTYEKNDEEE